MTAKRMRLLTASLAIIALIAALFVINPGLGRSASAAWDGTAAAGFESGTGDSSDPYIIKKNGGAACVPGEAGERRRNISWKVFPA